MIVMGSLQQVGPGDLTVVISGVRGGPAEGNVAVRRGVGVRRPGQEIEGMVRYWMRGGAGEGR